MKVGDFVEWNVTQFTGVDFPPTRGWIAAMAHGYAVVRRSDARTHENPYVSIRVDQLTPVPEIELVRRGSTLIS